MNILYFIKRFSHNADAIQSLVAGVSDEQARWQPTPEEWSILEVVNHLYDEERDDFRIRLDLTLHHPGQPWPPINPPGWVIERQYNLRDPAESLGKFLAERRRSIAWLEGLGDAPWSAVHEHLQIGKLSAGDLLASWLAHDFLHIRQLAQLQRQYIGVVTAGRAIEYAGPW
jgi:hypothetical protein